MVNLTAIIRCKAGQTDTVLKALVGVGTYAKANEPGTLDYRVIRSFDEADVLLTQERFKDHAAMEAHNSGAGSKAFFAASDGLLENVTIHIGEETPAF